MLSKAKCHRQNNTTLSTVYTDANKKSTQIFPATVKRYSVWIFLSSYISIILIFHYTSYNFNYGSLKRLAA